MPSAMQFLYLLPAICLLCGALLTLLLDVLLAREQAARGTWWLTLVAVALGFGAMFLLDGDVPARIFAVLAYDEFTAYAWRLILGVLFGVVLLSESYIRNRGGEPGLYYAMLSLFGFGALLLAASTNTIMLLLAVDLVSIIGYVLTGFLHYDKRSTEAAIKYLVYGSVLSAIMAYGLSWLYGLTGTTDYEMTARALLGTSVGLATPSAVTLIPVLIFILTGFSLKIGSAPFHQWLPDAFEGAPTPVTAALAIVPKVAGFAALVRTTMVMLPDVTALGALWRWPLAAFLSMTTMFVGNLIGLWQLNIKRLMAYSGIAQVGYALIGLAVADERSLSALLFYLTAYALAEMAVFAAITVMSDRTGRDDVASYRGLYHRAPVLAVGLLIGIFSLFGVPGTGGFLAKLWLFTSALEAQRIWLLVAAAVNSVISVAYYWKVIRAAFIQSDRSLEPVPVPAASLVAVVVAVTGVLVLGLFPNPVLRWTGSAVHVFFAGG